MAPRRRATDHILGIDLGGSGVRAVIIGTGNRVVGRAKRQTKPQEGTDAILSTIEDAAAEACWKGGIACTELAGAGVGAPGAIDRDRGVVHRAVNLGWHDLPLAALLSKRLGLPVSLENDVSAAAYGEYLHGNGKAGGDMLGVWVGTGLGGGLILGGRLFHGTFGTAGEFGRGVVLPWAPPGQGSLDQVCSRTGIRESLARLLRAGRTSAISDMVEDGDLEKLDNDALAKAYAVGDPLVIEVVDHAAMVLGVAIAGVVTFLSLGRVVVGGGVTKKLGRPWMKVIRSTVRRSVFPEVCRAVKVMPSGLWSEAGAIGAAELARERIASGKRRGR